MTALPVSYMRIVRDTTGFFGTYMPDLSLAPGVIGRLVDGVFMKEGRLEQCKGFGRVKHSVEQQPKSESDSRWTSKRVTITQAAAGATVPGLQRRHDARSSSAPPMKPPIFCHGTTHQHFANLVAVQRTDVELA